MGFDSGRRALYGNRFDNVRVQSSLNKEANFAVGFALLQTARSFVKDSDEFPANALALFFRISDALELGEEAISGVDANDVKAEAVAIHGERVFKLVLAEKAGVHEDVRQAIAHCFVDKDCRDSRIDAAAEAADGPFVADLLANCLDGFFDEGGAIPLGFGFADFE